MRPHAPPSTPCRRLMLFAQVCQLRPSKLDGHLHRYCTVQPSPPQMFHACLVLHGVLTRCMHAPRPGFDVDLIRWVAAYNGWLEDPGPNAAHQNSSSVYFYFNCTTLRVAPVVDILTSNNTFNQCSMGAGSFTITTARWLLGTRFSYPYFRTGLGVLIATQSTTTLFNPWAFLQP